MASRQFDVLILGGGVVGMSTACHLAMRGAAKRLRVGVVERDSSYRTASAVLSAGGLRQQFSLEENVRMSLYGLDFLRQMGSWPSSDDVQFKEQGYLFLASSAEGVQIIRENHAVQTRAGAKINMLEASQLRALFPYMDVQDAKLAAFGSSGEGWFDPWSLLQNMRRKAVADGVTIVNGAVLDLSLSTSGAGVEHAKIQDRDGRFHEMRADKYVMAMGAWAGAACMDSVVKQLGGLGSYDVWPVRPRRRCVFNFHSPAALEQGADRAPLTVDPSGVYFRPEGKGSARFICGVSPSKEKDNDVEDFDPETVDHELFDEIIWPTIAARVPAFERLKLMSFWSGLYEFSTLDQNAFMGRMPQVPDLLVCNGFSGHGLQQSPAAGRAMTELLLDGDYTSIDLSIFGCDRLLARPPSQVLERNIV